MNNIYQTKLNKILDKYKNINIYINENIKYSTDKQIKIFKNVDELKSIPDKSIIITNKFDNKQLMDKITTKHCILIMLLSIKNDNLNNIIKELNIQCVDIFSWHKDGKHDEFYFAIFQNE